MDDWHLVVHDGGELIGDPLLFSVPSGAVHEQSVDVDSVLWLFFDLFAAFFVHVPEDEGQSVNGDLVLSGVGLEDTGHETLREDHTGKPVGVRVALHEPIVHELHSLQHVLVPGRERLQRWVGELAPVDRDLVVLDLQLHSIEGLTHDDVPFDSLLDVD